jgi:hypothetical protein
MEASLWSDFGRDHLDPTICPMQTFCITWRLPSTFPTYTFKQSKIIFSKLSEKLWTNKEKQRQPSCSSIGLLIFDSYGLRYTQRFTSVAAMTFVSIYRRCLAVHQFIDLAGTAFHTCATAVAFFLVDSDFPHIHHPFNNIEKPVSHPISPLIEIWNVTRMTLVDGYTTSESLRTKDFH